MPGAFDVKTRVLRRRINAAVHEDVETHEYDVMDVFLVEEREHDKTCDSRSTEVRSPGARTFDCLIWTFSFMLVTV